MTPKAGSTPNPSFYYNPDNFNINMIKVDPNNKGAYAVMLDGVDLSKPVSIEVKGKFIGSGSSDDSGLDVASFIFPNNEYIETNGQPNALILNSIYHSHQNRDLRYLQNVQKISGKVWEDTDKNGSQNNNEPKLP